MQTAVKLKAHVTKLYKKETDNRAKKEGVFRPPTKKDITLEQRKAAMENKAKQDALAAEAERRRHDENEEIASRAEALNARAQAELVPGRYPVQRHEEAAGDLFAEMLTAYNKARSVVGSANCTKRAIDLEKTMQLLVTHKYFASTSWAFEYTTSRAMQPTPQVQLLNTAIQTEAAQAKPITKKRVKDLNYKGKGTVDRLENLAEDCCVAYDDAFDQMHINCEERYKARVATVKQNKHAVLPCAPKNIAPAVLSVLDTVKAQSDLEEAEKEVARLGHLLVSALGKRKDLTEVLTGRERTTHVVYYVSPANPSSTTDFMGFKGCHQDEVITNILHAQYYNGKTETQRSRKRRIVRTNTDDRHEFDGDDPREEEAHGGEANNLDTDHVEEGKRQEEERDDEEPDQEYPYDEPHVEDDIENNAADADNTYGGYILVRTAP